MHILIKHLDIAPTKLGWFCLNVSFQGPRSSWSLWHLWISHSNVWRSGGPTFWDDQSSKFNQQPEPLRENIKKLRDWQLLGLWSISWAITTTVGTCCVGLVGGGECSLTDSWYRCIGGIKQQCCQYCSLWISSEDAKYSYWFHYDRISQQLWMIFSDSVTQQFSDPRSIGFKGPIPSFRSLPFGQGLLSLIELCFSFFAAFSCSSTLSPRQLSHPLSLHIC